MRSHQGSFREPDRRIYYRTDEEALIERLTNWQRKQWQRAGCPREPAALRRFVRLQRDGSELHSGDVIAPGRR